MQIVSSGDNLHEMSEPIFLKKKTNKQKNPPKNNPTNKQENIINLS